MDDIGNISNKELESLKLQEKIWIETIEKSKIELSAKEKELDEWLVKICDEKIKFCEEVNDFDEKYGLSSSWWNAQMLSIQDPLIGQTYNIRMQKKRENDEVLTEIESVKMEISELERSIEIVKNKILEDKATLLEINVMQDDLKKEPFGPMFLSLKTAVQECKGYCESLTTKIKIDDTTSNLTSHYTISKAIPSGSRNQLATERNEDFQNSETYERGSISMINKGTSQQKSLISGTSKRNEACHYYRMLEKTTVIYKRNNTE